MEKFKFKYKRKGNKHNKPEIELHFTDGTKGDYAFEIMSLITMLMSIVHNDCKDAYNLVKDYMLDKKSPLYDEEMLKGLMQSVIKKTQGGDAHDEV